MVESLGLRQPPSVMALPKQPVRCPEEAHRLLIGRPGAKLPLLLEVLPIIPAKSCDWWTRVSLSTLPENSRKPSDLFSPAFSLVKIVFSKM